jgi:plastocyanin
MRTMFWMGLAGVVVMMACSDDPVAPPAPVPPEATLFTATGTIGATVNQFRAILGAANGGTAGEQPTGRREINWDGAAAIPFNNRNDFPADFFNTTVKAGAVFTTPGTGFRNDSTLFSEINAGYGAQFLFFSANNVFAPIGSNQFDQWFQVAGQPTPALVRGFGIVFSDVDLAGKTTIQLFAQDGSSLGTYTAPVRSDEGGFSFVGVTFADPIIARVRITLGTGALGANVEDVSAGGTADVAVLDNLIYGEPRGIGGSPVGQVTVGDTFFRSARNGSQNPAVDTIAAGSSVTWTWNGGSHSIQSIGVSPAVFRNSVVLTGANSTYSVTFRKPGTYLYQCGVHGSAMTGSIVVQ